MSDVLFYIWVVFSVLVGFHLVIPIVFFLVYRLLPNNRSVNAGTHKPDYAIIVTAYEQTASIPAVVHSLLKMNYSRFMIYVVADKCDISALHFDDNRVVLLRPEEVLQSNTRSHFYAIRRFRRDHECLAIIDSDNLVDPEFLNELNVLFSRGFQAVQGVRKAKNLDTLYACIDAIQDMYYHFYDREVLFSLGSSATLAGSGMAFTTRLYRECLEHHDIQGAGFDKVLQLEIIRKGHRIAFAKKAIVYDEKTSRSDQLVKQRARWFNTWFRFAGLGVRLTATSLLRLNWNGFLFGVMFLRPPLFLVIIASFILTVTGMLIHPVAVLWWLAALGLFILALVTALIQAGAERKIYRALFGIPVFVYYQVLSLFKARKANAISVATQHYHTSTIDEVQQPPASPPLSKV